MRCLPVVPGLAALLAVLPFAASAPQALALDIVVLDDGEVEEIVTDSGEESEADTDVKLSEKQEKWLTEFVKKTADFKKKAFEKEAESAAKELKDSLKLDDAAQAKLKELAPKAAAAAHEVWTAKCKEWLSPFLAQAGEGDGAMAGWEAEDIANSSTVPGAIDPAETEVWKKGVAEILTPEQIKAHSDLETERIAKLREQLADYLAASEAQASEVITRAMESALNRILQYSEIDEERKKKLKAASDEAVKLTVADWKVRAEKQLLQMSESQREQMTRNGGFMGVNTNEKHNKPDLQKVWQEASRSVLTEIEQKQIKERRAEARGRRAEALAMVLVSELERFVGFNDKQREEITKLAAPLLLKLPAQFFESPDNGYYSIDMSQLFRQMTKLTDEQLGTQLDAAQIKRWKAVNASQLSRNSYVRERLDAGKLPPPEEMDEVEVERILSGFLHRESRKMRKAAQSVMEAEVENIVRVAGPAPEAVAVLHTASKGAAEELTLNSTNNLESWVRGQFQNLKPEDVPGRLQNLYNPYFSERQMQAETELWTSTVERMLTEPQRDAWKKELEARAAWRRRGLTATVMTELEKRIVLSPEKRPALQEKITSVIAEYEPDFANYFSFGWHLQGYYSMIPLAMLQDKEMEEHFDKKQLETVKEKCLGNSLQYVEMIRRNHESRTGKSGK